MSRKITGIIPNRIGEDGLPVLTVEAYAYHPAERNRGAGFQVAAYCERCRDWHYHGIDAEGPLKGMTHRVAHCHGHNQDGPGAYWLDYDLTVPPVTPEALPQNRTRPGLENYLRDQRRNANRVPRISHGSCGKPVDKSRATGGAPCAFSVKIKIPSLHLYIAP